RTLQTHVKTAGDPDLEQALKRVELQMPGVVARTASLRAPSGAREATGSAASVQPDAAAPAGDPILSDPILSDPNEAYRSEVTTALKDAMLSHSSSLSIGPNE